ncbi:MAG: rod shape-determining protein MreC, partial [Chitinophagaceae bacterium]|nr:rod shape-determining protein MreC [Chitinophagaceae bacterium]
LTSTYSFNFPPGYFVRTVGEITKAKSSNFYILKIKPGANFYNLQQVFVVENLQYAEQKQLDKDTKNKIDDPKHNLK